MPKKLIRHNSSTATKNAKTKRMHVGKVAGKDIFANFVVIEDTKHMIRGSVMNGIRYAEEPFDKISNNLMSSNARIPAPLSHPSDEDGNFMDANDPLTFAGHNVHAFDTDWRVDGDILVSNTYINFELAKTVPQAEWLVNRIDKKLPIDRSTGLYLSVDDTKKGIGPDGERFSAEVTEIFELNHSAILNPDIEPGAKNNVEGIGMFTNSKGEKIDIEDVSLTVNASTPAMQLPLAPNDFAWNESAALERIKVFTNSTDKPSTNFRKFFLNFNQDDVDNFASYTNLFADVIDGVPHAVKQPITNAGDNDHAKVYINRFDDEPTNNNKQGFFKKVLNKVFSVLQGNNLSHSDVHEKIFQKLNEGRQDNCCSFWPMEIFDDNFVYRGDNDKLFRQSYAKVDDEIVFVGEKSEVERIVEFKPVTNSMESIMDRKQIIALLVNKGISVKDDISDDDLKAALNEAIGGKADEPNVDADKDTPEWAKNLLTKVDGIEVKVNANADKELDTAVAAVVALNKGIDEATAKTMGLASCNAFLAANGGVAIGVAGGQHQQNNQDSEPAALPE
jgi:hypothetical protein